MAGSLVNRLRRPSGTISSAAQDQASRTSSRQAARTLQTPTARVHHGKTTSAAQGVPPSQRQASSWPSRAHGQHQPMNTSGTRKRPGPPTTGGRAMNTTARRPAVATPAPIPRRSERQLYPQDPNTGQLLSSTAAPQHEHPPVSNAGSQHRPAPTQRSGGRATNNNTNNTDTRTPRPAVVTPAPIPGRPGGRLYPRDPTTGEFLSDTDWDAQIT